MMMKMKMMNPGVVWPLATTTTTTAEQQRNERGTYMCGDNRQCTANMIENMNIEHECICCQQEATKRWAHNNRDYTHRTTQTWSNASICDNFKFVSLTIACRCHTFIELYSFAFTAQWWRVNCTKICVKLNRIECNSVWSRWRKMPYLVRIVFS